MALKYIAEKKELTTARELENKFQVPFDTMSKVLQQLNSNRVLESIKGTKGGYLLKKDLYQITYAQLIEYVEGKQNMMICLTSKGTICDKHNKCNIIGPLDYLNRKTSLFYSRLTIGEILFGEAIEKRNVNSKVLNNLLFKENCPLEIEENA